MNDEIKKVVKDAVDEILSEMEKPSNRKKFKEKHDKKIHFVPQQYRVLGGMLHSLNIKFGTFIEFLLTEIIKAEKLTPDKKIGKTITFDLPDDTSTAIGNYINSKKAASQEDFRDILDEIVRNSQPEAKGKKTKKTRDVDAIFQTNGGQYVYLEVKYNDDHDTGKFESINSKLLITYAGLVQCLGIKKSGDLIPILYYFNASKGSKFYLPSSNVYAGEKLFTTFFPTLAFTDLKNYLQEIGNDPDIIQRFDEFYKTIMSDTLK